LHTLKACWPLFKKGFQDFTFSGHRGRRLQTNNRLCPSSVFYRGIIIIDPFKYGIVRLKYYKAARQSPSSGAILSRSSVQVIDSYPAAAEVKITMVIDE
jgi:hypothetical protein